ncbi:hypothetical protein [Pseudomonas sp. 25 R 14]|uniref:hypothetical protein n=1 Tax=Pseudomonas sp. 25 R 14 TaxID=1844109 RepID=UPI00081262F2|nr:hypothetical protein [Pseudomonas sp. 25 R 14]CRM73546.1 hypothetical protein [Pseudomonas sp. 25 R 14]
MTTNQTIDGVPGLRDLLERLHAEHVSIAGHGFWAAWKELRALLDAPNCKQCKGTGKLEHHLCPCGIGWGKPGAQPAPVAVCQGEYPQGDSFYRNKDAD